MLKQFTGRRHSRQLPGPHRGWWQHISHIGGAVRHTHPTYRKYYTPIPNRIRSTPLPHSEVFKTSRSTGHNLSGSSQFPSSISQQCQYPVCCYSHELLPPLLPPFALSDVLGHHRKCDSSRPRAVVVRSKRSKGPFAVSSTTRQLGGYRRSSRNNLE